MTNKILIKRGLEINRASQVPADGEPVWCRDSKKLYIGDGVTTGGISVLSSLGSAATKNTGTTAGTLPVLGSDGKISKDLLPTYKGGYFEVTNLNDLTALADAEQNCLVKITSDSSYYTLKGAYTSLSNWYQVRITARDLIGVTRAANNDLLLDANIDYTIA